jgi:Flp pilus assembly protein CpaB
MAHMETLQSTINSRTWDIPQGATTDVVLQNAQVLAIDQVADERVAAPSVAKTVTLEVDAVAGQKLASQKGKRCASLIRVAEWSIAELRRMRRTHSPRGRAFGPPAH